jgi:hypothetical protein
VTLGGLGIPLTATLPQAPPDFKFTGIAETPPKLIREESLPSLLINLVDIKLLLILTRMVFMAIAMTAF